MSGCLRGCSLLCRRREGPAIWLKQEGIYILNMPWSWHSLSGTISLRKQPVESLIPRQKGRLIPCIWHWTRLSLMLLLTCIFYFAQNSTCRSHAEREILPCLAVFFFPPRLWTVSECVFSFTSNIFTPKLTSHVSCLSLQGQRGYPGPPGLPGEPVSIFHRCHPLELLLLFTLLLIPRLRKHSYILPVGPKLCNVVCNIIQYILKFLSAPCLFLINLETQWIWPTV